MKEENKRIFTGIWIPKEISKKWGWKKALIICAYLYNAPDLTKFQIREARKILKIKTITPQETKKYILNNKGNLICEWCGKKVFSLNEHHFPIPKSKKGTDTVKICGTCHSDFHFINTKGIINYE